MTETTAHVTPDVKPQPVLRDLELSTREICDRCGPSAAALVEILLPSGLSLYFCGHHARLFGWEPPVPASRSQGSDH